MFTIYKNTGDSIKEIIVDGVKSVWFSKKKNDIYSEEEIMNQENLKEIDEVKLAELGYIKMPNDLTEFNNEYDRLTEVSMFNIYENELYVEDSSLEVRTGVYKFRWYLQETKKVYNEEEITNERKLERINDSELRELGYIKMPKVKRVPLMKYFVSRLGENGYPEIKEHMEKFNHVNDEDYWIEFAEYLDFNYTSIFLDEWQTFYEFQCIYALVEWCVRNKIHSFLKYKTSFGPY